MLKCYYIAFVAITLNLFQRRTLQRFIRYAAVDNGLINQ